MGALLNALAGFAVFHASSTPRGLQLINATLSEGPGGDAAPKKAITPQAIEWHLEAYFSLSFFMGMASSLTLRHLLHALLHPNPPLVPSTLHAATSAFFQFLVEALGCM